MKSAVLFLLLGLGLPAAAQVAITEFMADNTRTLKDDDGSFEDWIELHNLTSAPVDLAGWSLTDNPALPEKWKFPAGTLLAPRAYLVVFASDKNRRDPAETLHTNFKLSSGGEYLGLIRPDAAIATEFSPAYPPQVADISYGPTVRSDVSTIVQQGSPGRVLVPSDGSLGTSWTAPEFDDSGWMPATNGIGFETGVNELGPGYTADVRADNPAAWYRLEETGTVGIAAANQGFTAVSGVYLGGVTQNVATLQSPAWPGFEADNQGARFDGSNDKVDVPWQAALNGSSFSFSFWLKWNGSATGSYKCPLVSRVGSPSRGYMAYILPTSQQLSFWTGTDGASWDTLDAPPETGTILANVWYHIACTYDDLSKSKIIYLNGVQIAQKSAGLYVPNPQQLLRIGSGASEGAGQFWFPGDLDEVAVFDRALSAAEVNAQYASAAGTNASATISGQSPAGWWRLKDSTAPASLAAVNEGSAGAAANGVFSGLPVAGVDGPRPASEAGMPADNKALRTGTSGYVQVPYSPALNPPVFTVECWARATGGSGAYRAAVSSRNDQNSVVSGYTLYAAADNTWQFWTGSGASGTWDPIVGPAVVLNQWVHLAGSWNGTVKRFYVNGVQVGTGSLAAFNQNTVQGLRIGAGVNEAAANFFFQGDVDEVAVYPRALSAAEIAGRYGLGKNNNPAPPLNDFAGAFTTDLRTAMAGVNASAWFRIPFTVNDPGSVDNLTLRMKYDDGFQAYLNGMPVASGNVPSGGLTWNATASARSSNAEALQFESFNLETGLAALRQGTNVLAIHGLNLEASNPDFLQMAELELLDAGTYSAASVYQTTPSPEKANAGGSAAPGPQITGESSQPSSPAAASDLTITCRVRPIFNPVVSVTLNWRTQYNAVQQLAMNDDGTGGDAVAGDGIFSAVIPKTAYSAGQMVRWFFRAADMSGNTARWPLFLSPAGSPEYFGTMIANPAYTTQLPVWHWFAQSVSAAGTRTGTRGSVFFNGRFYDNIFIRQRGGATSTGSRKFDFNSGHHCFINDEVGEVEEANLNGTSLGGVDTIIRPTIAFEMMRRSGHAVCAAFPVMMRVNGSLDTSGGRGGVAYYVEQVDERYLDRWSFDRDGALYKMDQRSNLQPVFNDSTDGVQKRTRLNENNADLQTLVNAVHSASPLDWNSGNPGTAPVFPAGFTAQRTTKLFDLLNMAQVVNYLAARQIIADTDDTRKNFYIYRDTEGTGEWFILPWDKDGTLGISLDAAPWYGHPFQGDYLHRKSNADQWNYLYEACFNEPKIRDMYLRRLRTLMDTVLKTQPPAGTPLPGSLEALIDATWAPIAGTVPAIGTYSGQTPASIKSFLNSRRTALFSTYSAPDSIAPGVRIPAAQPAGAVVGFGQIDYLPVSGNQEEEFVQLVNPNSFDVDISGWELKRGIEHKFEPGTVIRAGDAMYAADRLTAFRARTTGPRGGQTLFVQGGFKGSISARGEIIELWNPMDPVDPADDRLVATLNTPVSPTPAQQNLRITEIMYDPEAGGAFAAGDYEFIELANTGSQPLTLTGASFTEGISFTFGTQVLAAGARLILVKNQAAFESRYGIGLPVAGVFNGSLDNSGERLRLEDAAGEEVLDFRYEGPWFPATHGNTSPGGGSSLVIADPNAPWNTWELQESWRASRDAGGTPGGADPLPVLPEITVTGRGSFSIQAEPARTFRILKSTDLTLWESLGYRTSAAGGIIQFADPALPANSAYYRVAAH